MSSHSSSSSNSGGRPPGPDSYPPAAGAVGGSGSGGGGGSHTAPLSFIIIDSDAHAQPQLHATYRRGGAAAAATGSRLSVQPPAQHAHRPAVGGGGGRSAASALCRCLSPRNSDDDDWPTSSSPHRERSPSPNEHAAGAAAACAATATATAAVGQSHSVTSHLMHLCRGLRARLAVSADAANQSASALALRAHQSRFADGVALRSVPYPVHTTIEYTHWLVPALGRIFDAAYYWGVMDRFEAEKLLGAQPEGTFLLRDSQQEEYLFSVSFRRYQRTLHARIEHKEHRFSFDSFDPGVFSAPTVTALVANYKDPARCLFYEPQLSRPLARPNPFSLQQLCVASISDALRSYDDIGKLPVPDAFRSALRRYHYKQPVRVNNTAAQHQQQRHSGTGGQRPAAGAQ